MQGAGEIVCLLNVALHLSVFYSQHFYDLVIKGYHMELYVNVCH